MTAVPTDPRFTDAQRAELERIEATPSAPESFDPIAVLRRVEALAESWRYKGEFGWGAWQEGYGPGPEDSWRDEAAAELLAVIRPADVAGDSADEPCPGGGIVGPGCWDLGPCVLSRGHHGGCRV